MHDLKLIGKPSSCPVTGQGLAPAAVGKAHTPRPVAAGSLEAIPPASEDALLADIPAGLCHRHGLDGNTRCSMHSSVMLVTEHVSAVLVQIGLIQSRQRQQAVWQGSLLQGETHYSLTSQLVRDTEMYAVQTYNVAGTAFGFGEDCPCTGRVILFKPVSCLSD